MGPPHPGQAIPLDLEEPFNIGPALALVFQGVALADAQGREAGWALRRILLARLQADRPELSAPEITLSIVRVPKKGGPRD